MFDSATVTNRLTGLRATAHPVRLKLLSLLTGAAMSAAEAARALGLSQAATSYHLRVLERAALVEVAEEVTIRGGRARRYRHLSSSTAPKTKDCLEPDDPAEREAQEALIMLLGQELRRRSRERIVGPSSHTDAELWVTPEAWERCVTAVTAAATSLHADATTPETPGMVRVSMTASLFTLSAP